MDVAMRPVPLSPPAKDTMSPRDDNNADEATWPQRDRRVNAAGLTFPLQLVLAIVVTALSVGGGIWATNSGMRSDVRDILTRMDYQAKLEDERGRSQDLQRQAMSESIKELRGQVKLLELQYQQIQLALGRK